MFNSLYQHQKQVFVLVQNMSTSTRLFRSMRNGQATTPGSDWLTCWMRGQRLICWIRGQMLLHSPTAGTLCWLWGRVWGMKRLSRCCWFGGSGNIQIRQLWIVGFPPRASWIHTERKRKRDGMRGVARGLPPRASCRFASRSRITPVTTPSFE